MTEANVCTRIKNTILEAGYMAFKIPDTVPGAGVRFSTKKGVDIHAGIENEFVAIEVKIAESLPKKLHTLLNKLQPGQVEHLDLATNGRSGYGFVFLCVYRFRLKVGQRRHGLYIFNWTNLKRGRYVAEYSDLKCKKERYQLNSFLNTFPRF